MQLDVIKNCDCFHTKLDMTLIDLMKVPFKNGVKACSLVASGELV